jgi:hypothetical protein
MKAWCVLIACCGAVTAIGIWKPWLIACWLIGGFTVLTLWIWFHLRYDIYHIVSRRKTQFKREIARVESMIGGVE